MLIRDKPCQHAVMLSGCLLVASGNLGNCSQRLRKLWQLSSPFSSQSCHSKLSVGPSSVARHLCGCEKLALSFVNLHLLCGDTASIFNAAGLVCLTAPLTIFKENVNHIYSLQRQDWKVQTTQISSIVTGTLWS